MKAILSVLACATLALAACHDDNPSNTPKDASDTTPDSSGPLDAGCIDLTGIANPTHIQIINACTDAQQIFKDSHPPLLEPDGSLPPLPP